MVDTEQSGVEQIYKPNDVVWVKISGMWWPAEVKDLTKVDPEVISGLRKSFICLVQFLLEESYLHINSLDNIYHYACKKRMDFVQEGFKKYIKRKNEKEIAKFPQAIEEAERLTGGNPDIIKIVQEQQKAEESTAEGHLSGKKRSTLNDGNVVQPQGSRSSLPSRRMSLAYNGTVRDTKSLPPHEGVSDRTPCSQHKQSIWTHTRPPRDEEGNPGDTPEYHCAVKNCIYTYRNYDVYMVHVEARHRHRKDIRLSNITHLSIAGPSKPKKERKRKEEVSTPVVKKKKLKVVDVDKEKTPKVKKTKSSPKLQEVNLEYKELLKDWDDDDEEMEGRRASKDALKTSSVDDSFDGDTQPDITLPPEITGKSPSQSVASNEKADPLGPPKLLSCFDFDDQEPVEPDLTSNLKFGQKLPRLISPEKSKPTVPELDSFLDELTVPEIPSLPSMRIGPSPMDSSFSKSEEASDTKLKNASSSSGKTDENDRKTKAVPAEELSTTEGTQASVLLDPKNDLENSTQNHFLAEGPLQSNKRKSFGLTEGTEDGSVSMKKAKKEINPSTNDDIIHDQIVSGNKDVGKVSLSSETSVLAPLTPVLSSEEANAHLKEMRISIDQLPAESNITSLELDKQSLIDTLTYSPSSVETNTSQKERSKRKVSKKTRHTVSSKKRDEPDQLSPPKDDIITALMDTLTHSPDSKSLNSPKRSAHRKKRSKRRSKSIHEVKECDKKSSVGKLKWESTVNITGDAVKSTKKPKESSKSQHDPDGITSQAAIAKSTTSDEIRTETRVACDGSSKKRYIRPSSDSSIDELIQPEVRVVSEIDEGDSSQLTEKSSPLLKTPRSRKPNSRRNSNDSSKKKLKLGSPAHSSVGKTKTSNRHGEIEDSCSKESSRNKLDFDKIEFLGASKLMPMTNAEGDSKERKSPSKKSLKADSQSLRTKVSGKSSSKALDIELDEKTPGGKDTEEFLGTTKLATDSEAGLEDRKSSSKKSRKSASQSPRSKVYEKSPSKDLETVQDVNSSITAGKATNEFLGSSKISPKTNTDADYKDRKDRKYSKKPSAPASKSSRSKVTGDSPLKDTEVLPDRKPTVACRKDADELSEADSKDRKSSKKSPKSASLSSSSKHLEMVSEVKPSKEEGKDSDAVVHATKLMTGTETDGKDKKSSKKSPKPTSHSRSKVLEQSPSKNLELLPDVKSPITGENAAGEFLGASKIMPLTNSEVEHKVRRSSKRSQRSASQSPRPKVSGKTTLKDLEMVTDGKHSIPSEKDSDEFLDAPKLLPMMDSEADHKERKSSKKSRRYASQSISGQSPLKNSETMPDGKDSDEFLGPPKLLPMTNSEAGRKDSKLSKKSQRLASQSSRSKVSEKSTLKDPCGKDTDLSKSVSSKHGSKKDSAVKNETVDISGLSEPTTIITAPVVSPSIVDAFEVPSNVRREEKNISVVASQSIEPQKQMSTDASTHKEVEAQVSLHEKLDFVSELEQVGSQKETTLESKEIAPPSMETLFSYSVDQLNHVQESQPQECRSKPIDVCKPELKMSGDLKPMATDEAISIPENLTALDVKSKSPMKADEISKSPTKTDETSKSPAKTDEISKSPTKTDEIFKSPMKTDEISSLFTLLHSEEDTPSSKSPTPFKVPEVRLDAVDDIPEISSAPARASRWDNPYPLKKGERASTPTRSLRSTPTKMASPGSKVKVEIKSGIKSGFRSPPPGVVCESTDSNVGDSLLSKLPTDCHDMGFFLPIRLETNSDELDAPKLTPLTQEVGAVALPITKSDVTDSLLGSASSSKLPADGHQKSDVVQESVQKSDFVVPKSVSPKVRSEIKADSNFSKLTSDQPELMKCDGTHPKKDSYNSSKPYDHQESKVVTSLKVDCGKVLGKPKIPSCHPTKTEVAPPPTLKWVSVDPILDISESPKLASDRQESEVNTPPTVERDSTAPKIGRSPRSSISTPTLVKVTDVSTVEAKCEDLEPKLDFTSSTDSPLVSTKATDVTTPKIKCDSTVPKLDSPNDSPEVQERVLTPSLSAQPLVDTPDQMFEDELSALQAEILLYTDADKVSADSLKRSEVEPESANVPCAKDASDADKIVDSVKCSSSSVKSEVDLDVKRAQSSPRQSAKDIEISLAQQVDLDSIPLPEPANLEAKIQNRTSPSIKVPGLSEAALLASLLKDDDSTLAEENIISSEKASNQHDDVAKLVSPQPAFAKKVEKRSPVKFSLLEKPNKFRSSSKLQEIALSKSKVKLREEKSAARRSLVSSSTKIPVSEPSILGDDETTLPILKTPFTKTGFSSSLAESPSMNPAEVKVVSSQFVGQPSSLGLLGGIDPLKELDINSIPIAFEEDLMKEGLLAYPTDGTSLHAPLIANFDSNVPMHAECISVAPPSISCINVPKTTANIAENFIDEVASQEEIVTSEEMVTSDQVEITTTEEVELSTTEVAVTDQAEVTTTEQVAQSADIIFPEKNVPTGNSTTKAAPKERRIYEARRIRRIYIDVADIDDPHFEYLCSLPEACLTVNPAPQPPTIHSSCLPLAVPGTPLTSAATSSLQPTAVHTAPLLSTGLAATLPSIGQTTSLTSTVQTTPLTTTVLTTPLSPTVQTIPLPSSVLTTPQPSAVQSTPQPLVVLSTPQQSAVRSAPPAVNTDANNVGNITNAPPKSNNEMKVFPPGSLVAVNSSGKTKPTYYVSMNTPSGVKLCHAVMKSKPASKSLGDDKVKTQSSISQPKVVIRPNLAGGKSNYVVAIKKDPATGKSLISKGLPTSKVPTPAKPHAANIISQPTQQTKVQVSTSPKPAVATSASASGRTLVPSSVSAKTRKLVSRPQPSRSIIIQQSVRSKTESDLMVNTSRKAP